MIQPSLDLKPVQVYCSFDNWSGTTIINPQTKQGQTATPNEYDGCNDKDGVLVEWFLSLKYVVCSRKTSRKGCFRRNIDYEIDLPSIQALTQISDACEQEVIHNCYENGLTGTSYWTDVNGEINEYWNGNGTHIAGCKCSETSSCKNSNQFCNCDSLRQNQTDYGKLTSRSLPITSLNYGGSSQPSSWISFELSD